MNFYIGNCNYLKGEVDYGYFLTQCKKITRLHYDELADLRKTWKPSKFIERNINKPTTEQRKENNNLRKKIQYEKTMSTKTPEAMHTRRDQIKKEHDDKIKKQLVKNIELEMDGIEFDDEIESEEIIVRN